MKKELEKDIQKKIIEYLKSENIFHFKTIALNKNGIPDIFCIYEGKPIFFEVKTLTGKTSKIQDYQIDRIRKSGGEAIIVRSLEDVKMFLNSVNKTLIKLYI